MRLLVTGGAGYIGSHFIARAIDEGYSDIVIVDDMSTGLTRRIPEQAQLYQLDIATDQATSQLAKIMTDHATDAVVHFAAKKAVGESVQEPEEYYRVNVGGTINLLSAMRASNVRRMVFSSSAAVYGEPDSPFVYETDRCEPINPYGESKYISELALANASRAWGLCATSLRYFNVAGARNSMLADTTTSNLMPAIMASIAGNRELSIFGNDYPTEDGTCVRDYVHIEDLADAHLVALKALRDSAAPRAATYNVGTGFGSSVLQVAREFQARPGIELKYRFEGRREGDPAALVANVGAIRNELCWSAQFSAADIVRSVTEHSPAQSES